MPSDTISFSALVRIVAAEARQMGLVVPGFRSPPALPGAHRTIRRRDGTPMIAVCLKGRPFADVVADVVEGVLVANAVGQGPDLRIRHRLLAAIEASTRAAA